MGVSSSKNKTEDISFNEQIKPKYITLNNKQECPIIGLGTSLINDKNDIQIIYQSIKDGVRLIDIEPNKEELVGEGINIAINNGIVRREDLFIVTKLKLEEKSDPENALRESIEQLKLEYVDLYLDQWPSCICINDPEKYKLIPVKDTWEQMERLVEMKLTKSIGVCNYDIQNLINILSICKIKPVVNEVEFHPYLYQKELKEFCEQEKITLFAYNPLVKGEYVNDRNFDLFEEDVIDKLTDKYINSKFKNGNLTKGQIILNWYMSLNIVPITGTSKPNRMKENLDSSNFKLSKDIISLLCSFEKENKQNRFNNGSNIFGYDIFE